MLSIVCKQGAAARLLVQSNKIVVGALPASSNAVAKAGQENELVPGIDPKAPYRFRPLDTSPAQNIADWDHANSIFYGPERDMKNFPTPVRPERPPKTRLGFISDSYFQAFYNKTGVTGPYLLGTGVLGFLLSKEYWVMDHYFNEFVSFWVMVWGVNFFFSKRFSEGFYKAQELKEYKAKVKPLEVRKERVGVQIAENNKAIEATKADKYVMDVKKENVELQLEIAYRQRIQDVYNGVKKRLDYQVEVLNTKKRFEQDHMVNWILDGVHKSITPQLEQQSIASCLQTLKQLSTAQK